MSFIYILGAFAVAAYILQILFGMKQIKHFNTVYTKLRRKGKVAIGRRPGKLTSGTIILLSINNQGDILEAYKMQGVTVLAKFKSFPQVVGLNIHELSMDHPVLAKEIKLTKKALLNAQEVYTKVERGTFQEETAPSPLAQLGLYAKTKKYAIENKIKGSV